MYDHFYRDELYPLQDRVLEIIEQPENACTALIIL